ncbi:MAG TPA: aspartate-semialdehyde dehydrogenase [Clostridiales bacterium]|nr:aspartate-semialdehyde dehydrogenase [Clostridiales bacterium]HQP70703.1 aspartate-semialdehyde dehydrogenase [Clostridiales bacterium]
MRKFNVAVVGATGAVGLRMLEVLDDRKFPIGELKLLASERSSGSSLTFKSEKIPVEVLSKNSFKGIDIALFSAGASVSREYIPSAVKSGTVVIDNSSAYRNDPEVPLVIPEINPDDVSLHRGIISNPNCTTAIMLTVLYSIYKFSRIKKIIVSSYQSVSGAGQKGINELEEQTGCLIGGKKLSVSKFPHQIANNVIPHIDVFTDNGYTKEEMKMLLETRKILHDEKIAVSATCVRVPVKSVHSMAVTLITEKSISVEKVRELITNAQGVQLFDDPSRNIYPMPVICEGEYDCFAGRIRKDIALRNAISLWICGDQLLKGAALNAVQIAELLIKIKK